MYKLSIVIPTFNRPVLLERAIRSINTNFPGDIEIIVCDDNSNSENYLRNLEVIRSVKEENPLLNVLFCQNERKKGVSGARNTAIQKATSEWILFLDDDDELQCSYVDYLLNFIKTEKKYKCAWCNAIIKQEDDANNTINLLKRYYFPQNKDELYRDLSGIGIGFGFIIEKNLMQEIGLFNEKLPVAEDTDLFMRLIESNSEITTINMFGVIIHEHKSKKLSASYDKHIELDIYKKLYHRYLSTIRKYPYLYCSYSMWIFKLYKEYKLETKAYMFCFEALFFNAFSSLTWRFFYSAIKQ